MAELDRLIRRHLEDEEAHRVGVRRNSTGSHIFRPRINFIEGTGITFTVGQDASDDEVDVTVAATGPASRTVVLSFQGLLQTNLTGGYQKAVDIVLPSRSELGFSGAPASGIWMASYQSTGGTWGARIRNVSGGSTIFEITGLSSAQDRVADATIGAWPTATLRDIEFQLNPPVGGVNSFVLEDSHIVLRE